MIKVNLNTQECSCEPIPSFLAGISTKDLSDLSWTDPKLGVSEFGWWPAIHAPINYNPNTEREFGVELVADINTCTVVINTLTEPIAESDLLAALNILKTNKLWQINSRCQEILTRLKTGYPDGEVLSWDQQVSEAQAFFRGECESAVLLNCVAKARGIDIDVLAKKVLDKARNYASASGVVIGNRQRLESLLIASETVIELDSIDIGYGWPEFI